jgi:hypothetical protein
MSDENLTEREDNEEVEEQPKSPNRKLGLENQLFTWDGWDDNGIMCPQFYKVELLTPVGEFPVGHKVPVAFFNGDDSTITFSDENDTHHTYQMNLTIGKKVETVE